MTYNYGLALVNPLLRWGWVVFYWTNVNNDSLTLEQNNGTSVIFTSVTVVFFVI